MRLWLPFFDNKGNNVFIDILDGVYNFMTDMDAERKGWCKNCKWAYGAHPHYRDWNEEAYDESYIKLCTLDFKKKFMPNLTLKDVGAHY